VSKQDIKILKEKKSKDLRALYRRLRALQDAIYDLPKIKLDKPRFVGYKRYYFLRDDIVRRKDANVFRSILEKLNTTVYSRKKDEFGRYDFDNPPFDVKQRIKTLSLKSYEKLTPELQKHFIKITNWDWRKKESRYEFLHPYMFVLKIKHNYITEVPILDKDMESEIGRLETKIKRENLWPKIDKLLGVRNRRDDWDLNTSKNRLMDRLWNQDIVNYFQGLERYD
jgi:hypothetical protein